MDRLVKAGCERTQLAAYVNVVRQGLGQALDAGLGYYRLSPQELKRLSRDLRDIAMRLERLNASVDALPDVLLGLQRFRGLPAEVHRCHVWVEAIRHNRRKNPKLFQRAALAQLVMYVEEATGTLHARELGELLNVSPEAVGMSRSRNARLIAQIRVAAVRGAPPPRVPDFDPKSD
jgi:hypothetical protein